MVEIRIKNILFAIFIVISLLLTVKSSLSAEVLVFSDDGEGQTNGTLVTANGWTNDAGSDFYYLVNEGFNNTVGIASPLTDAVDYVNFKCSNYARARFKAKFKYVYNGDGPPPSYYLELVNQTSGSILRYYFQPFDETIGKEVYFGDTSGRFFIDANPYSGCSVTKSGLIMYDTWLDYEIFWRETNFSFIIRYPTGDVIYNSTCTYTRNEGSTRFLIRAYGPFPPNYKSYFILDDIELYCGKPSTCEPVWFCDGWDTCDGTKDFVKCNSVYDARLCGSTYSKNYSEFGLRFCDMRTEFYDDAEGYANGTAITSGGWTNAGSPSDFIYSSDDYYNGSFSISSPYDSSGSPLDAGDEYSVSSFSNCSNGGRLTYYLKVIDRINPYWEPPQEYLRFYLYFSDSSSHYFYRTFVPDYQKANPYTPTYDWYYSPPTTSYFYSDEQIVQRDSWLKYEYLWRRDGNVSLRIYYPTKEKDILIDSIDVIDTTSSFSLNKIYIENLMTGNNHNPHFYIDNIELQCDYFTPTVTYECSDGIDNDGDGFIDYPDDLYCNNATDDSEAPYNYACYDGIDNDGDGYIDYPNDIGCLNLTDDNETNPECSDGIDNDGDGFIDYPDDLYCNNATDDSEAPYNYACFDGLDNDGDGYTDFNLDVGCDNSTDNNESPVQYTRYKDDFEDNSLNTTMWNVSSYIVEQNGRLETSGSATGEYGIFSKIKFNVNKKLILLSKVYVSNNNRFVIGFKNKDNYDDAGFVFGLVMNGYSKTISIGENGFYYSCGSLTQNTWYYVKIIADPSGTWRAYYKKNNSDVWSYCASRSGSTKNITAGVTTYNPGSNSGISIEEIYVVSTEQFPECSDGIDNDGDGLIDYPADLYCSNYTDTNESPYNYQCYDGIDNDGDGFIDYPADLYCSNYTDNNESPYNYECYDGVDNDNDGFIDYPDDLYCSNYTDDSEAPFNPQCYDGVDNDNDGFIDYPDDLYCDDIYDNNEFPQNKECYDGIDNDGDGYIDYPNDDGCYGYDDDSEQKVLNFNFLDFTPKSGYDRNPTITVYTSGNAVCRWSLTNVNYSQMPYNLTGNETTHTFNYSNFSVKQNNTYYVGCNDSLGQSTNTGENLEAYYVLYNHVPRFLRANFTYRISHNLDINLTVNATDDDGDSLTYSINDSRFTINSTTGVINKTNSDATIGTYNVSVTINDSYDTNTMWIYFVVKNDAPVVEQVVVSKSGDDLICSNTTTDADNDSLSWEIKWYIDNVYNSNFDNQSVINNVNLSLGTNWTCSVRAFDGISYSNFTNSTPFVAGDITPPTLFGDYLSSTTGSNDEAFTIYVNATDDNSVAWVKVEIEDPNGLKNNFTMSYIGNNRYKRVYTPSTDGVYRFRFYARDGSGNIAYLDSGLSYLETTVTLGASPGGGVTEITEITQVVYALEESDFSVVPDKQDIIVRLGSEKKGEFQIINNGDLSISVNVYINLEETDDYVEDWISFGEFKSLYNLTISSGKGLETNIKYIKFVVKPPIDAKLGKYKAVINIESGNIVKKHYIVIEVKENLYEQIIATLSSDAFSIGNLSVKWSMVLLLSVIALSVYLSYIFLIKR